MTKVIGVRFRTAGKIYFFAPGKFDIKCGDNVIVETARGVEFGRVVSGPRDVKEKEVVQPLKPVLRIATEQDCRTVEKNHQKEKEAFKICQEKIRRHGLEMKLIEQGIKPHHIEGYQSNSWILLDYGTVVIHIFTEQARAFYDLDRLWQDGESVSLDFLQHLDED